MREVTPTRSAALELADERKLMRQGYEFLDEKRTLLATEMLKQLRICEARTEELLATTREAADALAAAVERHGLDQLQVYPTPQAPVLPDSEKSLFLGLAMLRAGAAIPSAAEDLFPIDPSPEAKACRVAFEKLLTKAADVGVRAGNLNRLAHEYRRTQRRAQALENVLLPEVEDALKRVEEQLDSMDREETIRIRSLGRRQAAE